MRAVRLEITQVDNRAKKSIYVDFVEVQHLTLAKTIRYMLAKAAERFKDASCKPIRD